MLMLVCAQSSGARGGVEVGCVRTVQHVYQKVVVANLTAHLDALAEQCAVILAVQFDATGQWAALVYSLPLEE